MSAEHDSRKNPGPGLRARVHEALPAGARPTNTATHPVHRRTLEMAQGDVTELTRQQISAQFGDEKHIVLTLHDGDLDPEVDGEVLGLLEQTDGGILVFGVSYELDEKAAPSGANPAVRPDESCPECGTNDAFEVQRADSPGTHGRIDILLECNECGAVWDSYVSM